MEKLVTRRVILAESTSHKALRLNIFLLIETTSEDCHLHHKSRHSRLPDPGLPSCHLSPPNEELAQRDIEFDDVPEVPASLDGRRPLWR